MTQYPAAPQLSINHPFIAIMTKGSRLSQLAVPAIEHVVPGKMRSGRSNDRKVKYTGVEQYVFDNMLGFFNRFLLIEHGSFSVAPLNIGNKLGSTAAPPFRLPS